MNNSSIVLLLLVALIAVAYGQTTDPCLKCGFWGTQTVTSCQRADGSIVAIKATPVSFMDCSKGANCDLYQCFFRFFKKRCLPAQYLSFKGTLLSGVTVQCFLPRSCQCRCTF